MAETVQLDLFGDVEAAHTERLVGGLVCLRDVVPDAMEVVVHLAPWWSRERRGPGASGDWAYSLRNAGLRFELADEWWRGARERGEAWGWDRTPANLITWAELAALLVADSRRAALVDWVHGLAVPDPWWDLIRPHELWPRPQTWHPDYITGDHERPGWGARLAAWRDLQLLLTDAIARVRGGDCS